MTTATPKLDVPYQEPQSALDPWQPAQDPFKIGADSEGGEVNAPGPQPSKSGI